MGWVANYTTRPLYPRERPKDIRKSTLFYTGMKLGFHHKGEHRLRVFQNRVLRGTYRHSPTYATVNVPEGLAQIEHTVKRTREVQLKSNSTLEYDRPPHVVLRTFVSLRFHLRTENFGGRYKMNYLNSVLCYLLLLLLLLLRESDTA